MVKTSPDILQYAEYRKYLGDRYRFLKLNNRNFSHRYINEKVGIKSSGWFGDILSGRQRLKPAHARKVALAFKLDPKEQACLNALVDMDNADTAEDRVLAYEKWYEVKGVGQETIAKDRFKFYDRWYFSAFRELLALNPSVNSPEVLAAGLNPAISVQQAKEALALLTRLGLIVNGEVKSSSSSTPVLVKDSEVRTRHWKKMMTVMMKMGRQALEKYNKEERNFSGLTLTFSPEGMKKAGEEIAALRKRLLFLSEKDKNKNRVYNCLFQLYPISNAMEVRRVTN